MIWINANISSVAIQGYNFALDLNITNLLVFEMMTGLYIQTSVRSIQLDMFKSFDLVIFVEIRQDNMNNFFHKIGIAWSLYLPNHIHAE
jgi:hypothetical protein